MDKPRQSSPFISTVCDTIRLRHYSKRTESSYVDWVKRFIRFNDYKHSKDLTKQASHSISIASFRAALATQ